MKVCLYSEWFASDWTILRLTLFICRWTGLVCNYTDWPTRTELLPYIYGTHNRYKMLGNHSPACHLPLRWHSVKLWVTCYCAKTMRHVVLIYQLLHCFCDRKHCSTWSVHHSCLSSRATGFFLRQKSVEGCHWYSVAKGLNQRFF